MKQPKYKIGDKVARRGVKKALIIERVRYSWVKDTYYYDFSNYHLWFYENEIQPYKESED